jgi:hypothetical protein
VNSLSKPYNAMRRIFQAADRGKISLHVSIHNLHELKQKDDEALKLALALPKLKNWPIGTWDDQVATWAEVAGTFADAKQNQTKGGRFVDALCNGLDGFVTSDRQLVEPSRAAQINKQFMTKVITPEQLAHELDSEP